MGLFSKFKNIIKKKEEIVKEEENDIVEEVETKEVEVSPKKAKSKKSKKKVTSEAEEIKDYDKGLKKTRDEFVSKLNFLGIKYTKVSEEYFEELESILIKRQSKT